MKRNSSYDIAMSEIEHCIAAPDTVEGTLEAKSLARIIERFLDTLTEENRVIFMRRYWFSDSYADISTLTGLTEKNISVRLTRIRNSLRNYLVKEGVLL
jgi:RNA polymerase sigma-70 factor (ECF subfamily)